MDLCKTLHDEGLEAKTSQWALGWFEAMKDELENENGKSIRTFCYFLPTWGLHYILKPNSGNTDGDWAMIQGQFRIIGAEVGLPQTKTQGIRYSQKIS